MKVNSHWEDIVERMKEDQPQKGIIHNNMNYQRGFREGYIEGYNKALEKLQNEIQLAMLSMPIVVQIENDIRSL